MNRFALRDKKWASFWEYAIYDFSSPDFIHCGKLPGSAPLIPADANNISC